jgi:hypothetical protein
MAKPSQAKPTALTNPSNHTLQTLPIIASSNASNAATGGYSRIQLGKSSIHRLSSTRSALQTAIPAATLAYKAR